MKLKHTIAFILTIVIITLIFSSCTTEVSYIDDVDDNTPLRIYLPVPFNYFWKDNIDYYNNIKNKGNRKIEIIEFSRDNIEGMYEQILNEISLGKGPDIIAIDEFTDNYIDICKISKQNIFADMDILAENSKDFKFNNYNKIALDAGILDGKRAFMPLSYKVDTLVGVEECFSGNNLKIPDDLTLDAYLDLIEEYYQNTTRPAMLGLDPVYLLAECIEIGKPIEKTSKLQRLFHILKIENQRLKQVNYSDDPKYYFNNCGRGYHAIFNFWGMFIDNNLLFKKIDRRNVFFCLHEYYNIIQNVHNSNMVIFKQPHDVDSATKSYVSEGIAININSNHKNIAFEFVEFMLSKDVQSDKFKMLHLPVNEESLEDGKKNFIEGYQYFKSDLLNEIQIPKKMVDDVIEYVESVETCEYIGNLRYVYHNILSESIESYYKDFITYDEMIDEINNKLSIYYNE